MKNQIFLVFGLTILLQIQLFGQEDTIRFTTPQKLTDDINSGSEESLPIFSPQNNLLYFARTFHPGNTGGKNSGSDIWFSEKTGTQYTRAKNLSTINNNKNNVVVGVAKNGSRLYLLNQFSGKKNNTNPGLSYSDYNDSLANWGAPLALNIPGLEIKKTFYSAYVNSEEDFILWTLPGAIDSLGNDLFVSVSSDDGISWSPPLPLGVSINSEQDEISPFYDIENELLFFSRNKSENELDYDIYYSKKLNDSWTSWSDPVNAESLNSLKFDAYYSSSKSGEAYFCSNKNDSLSSIYLSKLEIEIPEDTLVEETVEEIDDEPVLIIETAKGTTTTSTLSSLSREELLAETTNIRFVYFDFNKYEISKKYLEVLDDAADILDLYPDVFLKIEGHTDAVGTEAYNQTLSEKRAMSAKEYLLIHGVEPSKVKTIGYGKREPFATNFTEEGRAMNRRVELVFREIAE